MKRRRPRRFKNRCAPAANSEVEATPRRVRETKQMEMAARNTTKSRLRGIWVGIVFSAIFFAVGAGFLVIGILPNLYDWGRMQDWVQAPAQLQDIELKSHHGDDSTTYNVVARYQYDYAGQSYSADRVGISGGSDNIGKWQHDTYSRMRSQRPFQVWVNPDDPTEAVFDREIRWELLGFKLAFVLAFGGFGGGLLWYLIHQKSKKRLTGVPLWQALPEWRSNEIRSKAKLTMYFVWIFAIVWNAISAPVVFIVPGEFTRGNHAVLIALLFPLTGAGLLYYAVKTTLNWRRFGPTPLSLDPFPGQIGGRVAGKVELRLPYTPRHRFRATLSCNHVYVRRSGKHSSTRRDLRWQDEQWATVEPGARGTRVRFEFHTDAGLPESSDPGNRSHDEWALQLHGDLRGPDFDRSWTIPVAGDDTQTARSGDDHGYRTAAASNARGRRRQPVEIPAKILKWHETGRGLELLFPRFRAAGPAVVAFLVGGVFTGVFVAAMVTDWDIPIFFAGIFGLVGVLAAILGLYLMGNSLKVTVSRSGVHTVRNIFGLEFARRATPDEIIALDKSITMQSNSGTRSSAYYALRAKTKDGRKITLGDGLPSASAADQVLEKIRTALQLDSSIRAEETVGALHERRPNPAVHERVQQVRRWINIIGFVVFAAVLYWQFGDVIGQLLQTFAGGQQPY